MKPLTQTIGCSSLAFRLKGFFASAVVVALSCAAYRYAPFGYTRTQFGTLYGPTSMPFSGEEFLISAATIYILLLAGYFLCVRSVETAKALLFMRVVIAFVRNPPKMIHGRLAREDRIAVLSTLLKAFFAPMMTMSLLAFCQDAWANGTLAFAEGLFNAGVFALLERHAFWV
jgi:hypothetical protein